jgi:hypothetical protein
MSGRISVLAIMVVLSASPVTGAMAQFGGRDRVPPGSRPNPAPPPTIGEPGTAPPAQPGSTEATQPSDERPPAASRRTEPQSADRQIADLQAAVATLQGEVERLQAQVAALTLPEGEYYITNRRPWQGVYCNPSGGMTLDAIRYNLETVRDRTDGRYELTDETITTHPNFITWANCRSVRTR